MSSKLFGMKVGLQREIPLRQPDSEQPVQDGDGATSNQLASGV
jgi:hypothetical protein